MAKRIDLKQRYQGLHRYMCGLTMSCVIVTVIGMFASGSSAERIVLWAFAVCFVLMIAEYLIIRMWSAWEEVRTGVGHRR